MRRDALAEGSGGGEVITAIIGAALTYAGTVLRDRKRARQELERKAKAGEEYEDAEQRRWRDELRMELDRCAATVQRLRESEAAAWDRCSEARELMRREYESGLVAARRTSDLEDRLAEVTAERDLLLERMSRNDA